MSFSGANIVILARNKGSLDVAKEDVLKARKSETQTVDTISVDLTLPEAVSNLFQRKELSTD